MVGTPQSSMSVAQRGCGVFHMESTARWAEIGGLRATKLLVPLVRAFAYPMEADW